MDKGGLSVEVGRLVAEGVEARVDLVWVAPDEAPEERDRLALACPPVEDALRQVADGLERAVGAVARLVRGEQQPARRLEAL